MEPCRRAGTAGTSAGERISIADQHRAHGQQVSVQGANAHVRGAGCRLADDGLPTQSSLCERVAADVVSGMCGVLGRADGRSARMMGKLRQCPMPCATRVCCARMRARQVAVSVMCGGRKEESAGARRGGQELQCSQSTGHVCLCVVCLDVRGEEWVSGASVRGPSSVRAKHCYFAVTAQCPRTPQPYHLRDA